jgi:hypothetical protein
VANGDEVDSALGGITLSNGQLFAWQGLPQELGCLTLKAFGRVKYGGVPREDQQAFGT